MLHQKIMEQINQHVGEIIKNNPFQDVEKNVKSIILSVFNKLDLVTREEFDTQQRVLLATRKKLEELEQTMRDITKN